MVSSALAHIRETIAITIHLNGLVDILYQNRLWTHLLRAVLETALRSETAKGPEDPQLPAPPRTPAGGVPSYPENTGTEGPSRGMREAAWRRTQMDFPVPMSPG